MITRDFSVISMTSQASLSLSLYYSQKSLTHNIYKYPLELFLSAQIDQGDRTEANPSLAFPTAMVVKVKDAETKRNEVSVAHTGWNKRKKN